MVKMYLYSFMGYITGYIKYIDVYILSTCNTQLKMLRIHCKEYV